jgi:hypothetical protein
MSFLDEGPEIDFDDLYRVWKEVAKLEQMVYNQESILGVTRAGYKKLCIQNREFWPHGKPPSMEYLKQVVHHIGNSEEDSNYLDSLEIDLARYRREWTEAKGLLDVMHEKIRTWQTKSANARKTLVLE